MTPQLPLLVECSQAHYHCHAPTYLYCFVYFIATIIEVNIFCTSSQQSLLHDRQSSCYAQKKQLYHNPSETPIKKLTNESQGEVTLKRKRHKDNRPGAWVKRCFNYCIIFFNEIVFKAGQGPRTQL